jgi:hypothetical protein
MPTVKNVGEPCAGEPHARFDVGGGRKPDQSATPRGPGASRRPYRDPDSSALSDLPQAGTRLLLGKTVREANSGGDLKPRAGVIEENSPEVSHGD